MKLAQRIEDVLTVLYDYEYINIERFYNSNSNVDLLDNLNNVLSKGESNKEESELIQCLYDDLDSFIKFETNYNSEIGDF